MIDYLCCLSVGLFRGHIPNNEVRVGLLHDELLRTNVLLLSRIDNVPLLQDLHGEGFVLIALELNLRVKSGWMKFKYRSHPADLLEHP